MNLPKLPITDVLPDILSSLAKTSNLVLVAPPGAGKTTLVPLALLDATWRKQGRILVLEPRRLAARAAASRMAQLLGEEVGRTVGYRVRFDTRVSKETVIEVVTEGVFNRMLAQDPGLETTAAVLFDEFHERSLDSDLALALCLDLQAELREDLRLIPMSATLDGAAVARLMNAQTIESQGRSFPVAIEYRERGADETVETAMASALRDIVTRAEEGSVLAFLPGQREIERTADLLHDRLPYDVEVHRLYGALPQQLQDAAIRPASGKRKIVLSSAIAETSLTIEGITTVVDSGLSRQPVFEPATGLTRLQTVRAPQASITQRSGRAGRLGPGRAVRLWRAEQTAALPAQTPPEILNADLASLLLDLADWGVRDPSDMKWLDEPPSAALNEARTLLQSLDAINREGRLTPHGRAMKDVSLPPRLAHMVLRGADYGSGNALDGALLALLVQERGAGGNDIDLSRRLDNLLNSPKSKRDASIVRLGKSIAKSLTASGHNDSLSAGDLLGFAYPDRIAENRGSAVDGSVRFKLANGRGAQLDATSSLARERYIVVVDMAGRAGAARILSAAPIEKTSLQKLFADRMETIEATEFDVASATLQAQATTRFGALVLGKPERAKLSQSKTVHALLHAVEKYGLDILPWRKADRDIRDRMELLHKVLGEPWPDVSEASLVAKRDEWLAPFLDGQPDFSSLSNGALTHGLLVLTGGMTERDITQLLPGHFDAPSGSRIAIDYEDGRAVLRIRPQELFGLDQHPAVMNGGLPLEIELLSPAGRAIQITQDLPLFWRGSWKDVRADLRGRYPKHPWPENPLEAEPTRRAKPRKK